MLISRSAQKLISKDMVSKASIKALEKPFFKDTGIDYELLQKDLIESHLVAFNYYETLLKIALQCGSKEHLLMANTGMITHSKEIAKLSGITYFADINAAAGRLEREGYIISEE
jgi:hypothetical protein